VVFFVRRLYLRDNNLKVGSYAKEGWRFLHNNNTSSDVGACGQQAISDTDMLQIDFAAYDPNLFLAYYTLELHYGDNIVCNLLDSSLPGWSLTPSPVPPAWAPAAAQVCPYYGYSDPSLSTLGQGAARRNGAEGPCAWW
jgi:hypothetical protein